MILAKKTNFNIENISATGRTRPFYHTYLTADPAAPPNTIKMFGFGSSTPRAVPDVVKITLNGCSPRAGGVGIDLTHNNTILEIGQTLLLRRRWRRATALKSAIA